MLSPSMKTVSFEVGDERSAINFIIITTFIFVTVFIIITIIIIVTVFVNFIIFCKFLTSESNIRIISFICSDNITIVAFRG